ncbi:MAG: DUF5996 family protein, partial [Sulfurifustis sp.]
PRTAETWPSLPFAEWKDACATLHRWTQIVGKIRLAQTPWINHSWHVTLYVTARGLTTSPIPHTRGIFQIDFDFIDHQLLIRTDRGDTRTLALRPQAVADFYGAVMTALADLDVPVRIHTMPCELTDAVPFEQDRAHASYSPEHAHRLWRILAQTERVFRIFRGRFIGKCSPIHFFWGSFDLAVTRFSGRTAPRHPGGVPHLRDAVTREAYSHEVSSCGFWPGGGAVDYPAFYAYAYPSPEGFADAPVRPAEARYHRELGEFLLPYEDVRTAADPDDVLLEFLQSTYEAAANLASWDRSALERDRLP